MNANKKIDPLQKSALTETAPQSGPVKLDATLPKRSMPKHIKEQLDQLTNRKVTQ
jgi:hypothetical protein